MDTVLEWLKTGRHRQRGVMTFDLDMVIKGQLCFGIKLSGLKFSHIAPLNNWIV